MGHPVNAYVGFRVREVASGREGVVDEHDVDGALVCEAQISAMMGAG